MAPLRHCCMAPSAREHNRAVGSKEPATARPGQNPPAIGQGVRLADGTAPPVKHHRLHKCACSPQMGLPESRQVETWLQLIIPSDFPVLATCTRTTSSRGKSGNKRFIKIKWVKRSPFCFAQMTERGRENPASRHLLLYFSLLSNNLNFCIH